MVNVYLLEILIFSLEAVKFAISSKFFPKDTFNLAITFSSIFAYGSE